MTTADPPLWLQTCMALVGFGGGLLLHLKWHPLRRHFSDAWDMLQSLPWLVLLPAALPLLAGPGDVWSVPSALRSIPVDTAWQGLLQAGPLACRDVAVMMLGFFPPWPTALVLPLFLTVLAWRIWRVPYRYSSKRREPLARGGLTTALVLGWMWLLLEGIAVFIALPEGFETLRLMLRWCALAWSLAALQMFMIHLVQGWEAPASVEGDKDLGLALERSITRWRHTLVLALLNLPWLLAWDSVSGAGAWAVGLLMEASFFFAVIPVVLAVGPGSWAQLAAGMMALFLRSWLSLLGFGITAVVILMTVHAAMQSLLVLAGENSVWTLLASILIALVLATMRSWLFLILVLILLRHGLKTVPPTGATGGGAS